MAVIEVDGWGSVLTGSNCGKQRKRGLRVRDGEAK
jgi:hypothetical protein